MAKYIVQDCLGKWDHPVNVMSYTHHNYVSKSTCEDTIKNNVYYLTGYGSPFPVYIEKNSGYLHRTLVGNKNQCKGAAFTSHDGQTFSNAIVLIEIFINVATFNVDVNLQTNMITLAPNFLAPYPERSAYNEEIGRYFWDIKTTSGCEETKLRVVYQGKGRILLHTLSSKEKEKAFLSKQQQN
jgi:hypothetical protein